MIDPRSTEVGRILLSDFEGVMSIPSTASSSEVTHTFRIELDVVDLTRLKNVRSSNEVAKQSFDGSDVV